MLKKSIISGVALIVFLAAAISVYQTYQTKSKFSNVYSDNKANQNFRENKRLETDSNVMDLDGPDLSAYSDSSVHVNPDRNAYFGDLHVHTMYSLDAFITGTIASPNDAYRYAQGGTLKHPNGYDVMLTEPLDFYAVTDHAEFLGVAKMAADPSSNIADYEFAKPYHNINDAGNYRVVDIAGRLQKHTRFSKSIFNALENGDADYKVIEEIVKSTWINLINAADEAYRPGKFTTFAAYEFTAINEEHGNLHRNVIFADTNKLPVVPLSSDHSLNPEGLWHWMDGLRSKGIESLAIPHNSNASNGSMFMMTNWAGERIDKEYAELRMRNEPLVEISQVKGTSDTHPVLSPNDEWADFEINPYRISAKLPSEPEGSYIRGAYLDGLKLQKESGANPYLFGVVGSSDTHTGASSINEKDHFGKWGLSDGQSWLRGSVPAPFFYGTALKFSAPHFVERIDNKTYLSAGFQNFSSSGLAGVWAESNTRESIFAALRRKETFGTSGPRIKVRFFASYNFEESMINESNLIRYAYDTGVSMGGSLKAGEQPPRMMVWAVSDASSAKLQRVQIIKGYIDVEGSKVEKIHDVACSNGLKVDNQTRRCPDNGARVNLTDCSINDQRGSAELRTFWQDPDYDPKQEAFYYVRVLENPVCRWSTWDAIRAGFPPRPDIAATIQERAWSSPIWLVQ